MAPNSSSNKRPGEVGVTGGHGSIRGCGLGAELAVRSASQLDRQGVDDPFKLARALEICDLAEPGDDPVPGLARLVSIRLGQGEIAVSLLPATDPAHLHVHQTQINATDSSLQSSICRYTTHCKPDFIHSSPRSERHGIATEELSRRSRVGHCADCEKKVVSGQLQQVLVPPPCPAWRCWCRIWPTIP